MKKLETTVSIFLNFLHRPLRWKNSELENYLTLNELCKKLSISIATGKNWVKLNKITPDKIQDGKNYFSLQNVEKIENEIKSGSEKKLKSRRNKSHVTGNFLYKDYISSESPNLNSVQQLLDLLTKFNVSLTDENIQLFIAEAALQLFFQKRNGLKSSNLLLDYLKNNRDEKELGPFLKQLYSNKKKAIGFLQSYPELFRINYFYENKEDLLGLIYISCKNLGNRKATGSYYTPTTVVDKLISNLTDNARISNETKICDPCCGTGNFLLQLPDFFKIENIFGFDIDEVAIKVARINVAFKCNCFNYFEISSRIKIGDFLLAKDIKEKFDCIIGNPPWGYSLDESIIPGLRSLYESAKLKNIESYDVFIERALQLCQKEGYISFVLPEAVLNVKSHEAIRNIILENTSIKYIEYLGNSFDKVNCPSIIIELQNTGKKLQCRNLKVKTKEKEFVINEDRKITSKCFSFLSTDEEYFVLSKLDSLQNKTTLFNHADFALGIVTGDNEKYISNLKTDENEIVLKGMDIHKYKYSEPDNYITFIPESFQQVAPENFYRADEKLLYRFISNQLVFAYDNKQTLSLNSCNILIPRLENLNIKYIMAVLNSSVAQFYFKKQFNSIKILRSHIEQVPIPAVDARTQGRIISLVDSLLKEDNQNKLFALYEKIDEEIFSLFNLTPLEISLIKESLSGENLFLF